MTRAEEWLLSRMTVRRWLLSVVVVAGLAFYGGREYMRYELRREMRKIIAEIPNTFTRALFEQANERAEKAIADAKAKAKEKGR